MTNKKPLIYISGKYSDGIIIKNIEKAEAAAVRLMRAGFDVICPHKNTSGYEKYEDIPYEQYIEMDLNILERCDGIYMLDNWRESKGAKTEFEYAAHHCIPIISGRYEEGDFTPEWFISQTSKLNRDDRWIKYSDMLRRQMNE
jgi:nucleoside 2-deoxyribosyltransferase